MAPRQTRDRPLAGFSGLVALLHQCASRRWCRPAALLAVGVTALLVACSTSPSTTDRPRAPVATSAAPSGAPTSGAAALPTATPERQTVKYGAVKILSMAPVYLASDRGYFTEQGI